MGNRAGKEGTVAMEGVGVAFGGQPVLADFSLEIPQDGITVLLGPSGCGKTTLMRLLAGLLPPQEGMIRLPPGFRWSYLFQEPRLLPWMSIRANLDWVLREPFPDRGERIRRREDFLELVELTGAGDSRPGALSGGMRQRAAMARAFAWGGDGLLMDEPFQALDLRLKHTLIESFLRLWQAEPKTGVLVTHDLPEALLLGDTVILLTPRPASVAGRWTNPLPRNQRHLDDPALMALERELYRGFLEGAP